MVVEFIQQYPHISIIGFSILVALVTTIINYFMLDKEKLHSLKARQKELQEEMKKHKDNPQKVMELNKEIISQTGEMMKHSMKPIFITFIPIILLFKFLKDSYAPTDLAEIKFLFPIWVWWYILAGIVSNFIFRKLFKLP